MISPTPAMLAAIYYYSLGLTTGIRPALCPLSRPQNPGIMLDDAVCGGFRLFSGNRHSRRHGGAQLRQPPGSYRLDKGGVTGPRPRRIIDNVFMRNAHVCPVSTTVAPVCPVSTPIVCPDPLPVTPGIRALCPVSVRRPLPAHASPWCYKKIYLFNFAMNSQCDYAAGRGAGAGWSHRRRRRARQTNDTTAGTPVYCV